MAKGEGGAPNANNAPGHVKAYDKRVAAATKAMQPKAKTGSTFHTPAGGRLRKGTTPGGRKYVAAVSPKGNKSVSIGNYMKSTMAGQKPVKTAKGLLGDKHNIKGPTKPRK